VPVKTPNQISEINGLRGLAIVGVLFQHVGVGAANGLVIPGIGIPITPLTSNGWTGVNLFFILSGFVLYLPYAQGRREMNGARAALAFYRHRFLRLMPLYYLAAIVLLIATYLGSHVGLRWHDVVQLLAMSFVFERYAFAPGLNPSLWSIGVEVLFSLSFPVLIFLMRRFGTRQFLTAVLFGALVVRVAGRVWNPAPLQSGPNFLSDNLLGRLDEFALGMAVAKLYANGKIIESWKYLLWPGILLILAAWIGFDLCSRDKLSVMWAAPCNNVLDAGYCAILIVALGGASGISRVLSWRPLQLIGMMCYSLYIWHMPILSLAGTHSSLVLILLPVTFVVAALSYRFIEFGRVQDWRPLFLARARPALPDL
jgi:peptidoglycan/LPS O-acetylase OafA/YrhL